MIGELHNKGTNQMTNQGETGPPGDIRPALPPRHGQPPNALSIFLCFRVEHQGGWRTSKAVCVAALWSAMGITHRVYWLSGEGVTGAHDATGTWIAVCMGMHWGHGDWTGGDERRKVP